MSANNTTFRLKRVVLLDGRTVPIILQNENGPCPLIAIANILLIKGMMQIHPDYAVIDADFILSNIKNIISRTKATNPAFQENHQKNLEDAIQVLPKLLYGMDINIRFRKVNDFEYTTPHIIFDLLNINLYHGWLCDPQSEYYPVVSKYSYNQLMDKIVLWNTFQAQQLKKLLSPNQQRRQQTEVPTSPTSTNVTDESSPPINVEEAEEGRIAEAFHHESASQITYHGMAELHETVKQGELCVFFRNNHFATMIKYGASLYLLCTDEGYYNKPEVVWERFSELGGDNIFVDGNFKMAFPQQKFPNFTMPEQKLPTSGIDIRSPAPFASRQSQQLKTINTVAPTAATSPVFGTKQQQQQPAKKLNTPQQRYQAQAGQLRELNQERQMRQQQQHAGSQPQQQQQQQHHQYRSREKTKEYSTDCSIQ